MRTSHCGFPAEGQIVVPLSPDSLTPPELIATQGAVASLAPDAFQQWVAQMSPRQLAELSNRASRAISLCNDVEDAMAEIVLAALCNYELWRRGVVDPTHKKNGRRDGPAPD